jgi:hypothetical protein
LTAGETNSARFDIQRSSDGTNYSTIGSVNAAGNSSGNLNYDFTDPNPTQGNNFYRLKQVDLDGGTEYSNIVVINGSENNRTGVVLIYQSRGRYQATVTGMEGRGTMNVYDGNGRRVKSYVIPAGSNTTFIVDMSSFGSGVYIYQVVPDSGPAYSGKILVN